MGEVFVNLLFPDAQDARNILGCELALLKHLTDSLPESHVLPPCGLGRDESLNHSRQAIESFTHPSLVRHSWAPQGNIRFDLDNLSPFR